MLIEPEESKHAFCKYKVSASGPLNKSLTSGGFCKLSGVILGQVRPQARGEGGIMGAGTRASASGLLSECRGLGRGGEVGGGLKS